MRIRQILCLSVALVLPQLAPAKVPMPEQSLGQIESILDFCVKADSQAAPKYNQFKKMLAGDASKKELDDARKTPGYKDGYQGTVDQLAKVPKEKAVKTCSAFLEGK